ncbi:TPA: hypothetical protein QDB15_006668 [Burkholderia vietnamiensis]|uniref:Uncharacterized protein n=1 Tax=Burkholderia vietnamiensis TaxID=60552 RepID=A0AA45BAT8_BURVI|nr:hypothetical protein [Burkholderia vietnamiensis]MCA8210139.1 hypothetical protein [Burkholderia vietnamiensis]PRH40409.1 hypothetical protein C6T65_20975 [Burkholderia vietnamiensis]HDR9019336.1 hypothetical protein [Burkholderia vietnamiensis]HDR9122761.1 hypothetical protein [Burkholderia vietnamiensis]
MKLTFGKYKGTEARKLLFDDPAYVRWLLGESGASGGMLAAQKEFTRLIAALDKKPFAGDCAGGCKQPATRASAYANSPTLFSWCDDCDPYSKGALPGKLRTVRTYADAERHVNLTAEGHRATLKAIIRELAMEKGMAKRFTASALAAFLP